ncbi:MAG TPA: PAS domain-containing protein [Allosphingosinicella sp.]|jgi:two-component system sensor kinase FixL
MAASRRAADDCESAAPVDESMLPSVLEVLENTTDSVALVDRDWKFTFLNRNAVELLGRGADLVGTLLPDLFESERGSAAWKKLSHAAFDRESVDFEFYAARQRTWFEVHAHPIPSGLQIYFRDITARKASENALQESEERLRLALEAVGDGAWDWDIAAGHASLETRLVETMGYGARSYCEGDVDFERIIEPADLDRFRNGLIAHLKGETESYSCEFRLRAAGGSWHWILARGRVVERDPATGRALRMVGVSSDVTARKAAEEQALEYSNLLTLAQRGAKAGAWTLDTESRRIRLWPETVAMLGLPGDGQSEFDIDEWVVAMHVDDAQAALGNLMLAARTGSTYSSEFRMRTGDGSWRWMHGIGDVVGGADGGRTRVVGLLLDVTERKEAEDALRESEEMLRLALDAAGDGAWDWNVDTDEVSRSPRLMRRFGYDPEALGQSSAALAEKVHPEDVEKVRARLRDHLDGLTESYSAEYRLRDAAGEWRWMLDRGRAVKRDPFDARVTRMVGTSSDITRRKLAELELQRVQAELVHLSRLSAMGEMASTLAHELNQPLSAISNYARGVLRMMAGSGDPMFVEALRGLEASALRAGEIVRRLRDYVTKGDVDRRAASLSSIVADSCALGLVDADVEGISWAVALDPGADKIHVDRIQIQQVLLNLIRNACDAMMGDGVERHLGITSIRTKGRWVEVAVSDTGSGISDEVRDQLFTAFVSTKASGMGVGLSICRTIVEAHEGRIWAEPHPGGGTIVRFTLPLA